MINIEIILNVLIGLILYNLILTTLGSVLIKYFLDNSDTIQKEKKSFRDKLNEKLAKKE